MPLRKNSGRADVTHPVRGRPPPPTAQRARCVIVAAGLRHQLWSTVRASQHPTSTAVDVGAFLTVCAVLVAGIAVLAVVTTRSIRTSPDPPAGAVPALPRHPLHLRADHRERAGVIALLEEHFVDGRLTTLELEARTALAWRAVTCGDLVDLLADLQQVDERWETHAAQRDGSGLRAR